MIHAWSNIVLDLSL